MFSVCAPYSAAQTPLKLDGVSLSLRSKHLEDVLAPDCPLEWLELLADNWMHMCGPDLRFLEQVCERYPITLHCVGMNIGGTDDLDAPYLNTLRDLRDLTNARSISDHLCFNTVNGHRYHDLLPLPLNRETLEHLVPRIEFIQDILQSPLCIENASSYFQYRDSNMGEAEFLNELCQRSGCRLLLDLNNICVSAHNLGFNAKATLAEINSEHIEMLHLGGHHQQGALMIDSHSTRISASVWELLRFLLAKMQAPPSIVIEWDNDLPKFSELLHERTIAQSILREAYETSRVAASL